MYLFTYCPAISERAGVILETLVQDKKKIHFLVDRYKKLFRLMGHVSWNKKLSGKKKRVEV